MKENIPIIAIPTLYVTALVAYLKEVTLVVEQFTQICTLLDVSKQVGGLIVFVPFLLTWCYLIIRARLKKKNQREANDGDIQYQPRWFRVKPFQDIASDREDYQQRFRLDKMEDRIFEWINSAVAPILLLSGESGSCKSSMLNASVMPNLRKSRPDLNTVSVCLYSHPESSLAEALLKNGVIWQKKPSFSQLLSLRELVEKAAAKKPLLIVIDQFEEFLSIRSDSLRRPIVELLQSISSKPIAKLQILLVCREENLDSLEADIGLLKRGMDSNNWMKVDLFNRELAKRFLNPSNNKVDSILLDKLLAEADKLERRSGWYRPIVLNFLGIALSQRLHRKGRLAFFSWRKINLLRELLNQELRHSPVNNQVLRSMMIDNGNHQAVALQEVIARTGLPEHQVITALRVLSSSGWINSVSEIEKTWTISHDFIRNLLIDLFSIWKLVVNRSWSFAGVVALFAFYITTFIIPADAFKMLMSTPGVSYGVKEGHMCITLTGYDPHRASGKHEILPGGTNRAGTKDPSTKSPHFITDNHFEKLIDLIIDSSGITPVECLEIDSLGIQQISDNIARLGALRVLIIKNNIQLESLPDVFDQLSHLQTLVIHSNDRLTSLPGSINQLSQLRRLSISFNAALEKLFDNISPLSQLRRLEIVHNAQLSSLPVDITSLLALQSLMLSGTALVELPADLGQLSDLQKLDIVSNSHLMSIPSSVGELTQLKKLYIGNNNQIVELPESLGNLSRLEQLTIIGRNIYQLPKRLGELSALKTLTISGNNKIQFLPDSIVNLPELKRLTISGNKYLVRLPNNLSKLRNIKKLEIMHNANLRYLPPSLDKLGALQSLTITNNKQLFISLAYHSRLKHAGPFDIRENRQRVNTATTAL